MRRPLRSSLAILFVLAGAACARQGGAPTPPTPPALAEASADVPHLMVQVLEVKRTGPDVLTVSLQFVHTGGPGPAVALGSLFAAGARDEGTLADMYLWDEAGQRKYYVLRDNRDRPRCSDGLADLVPGEPLRLWAAFPAPPLGVTRLTICLAHLPPMPGVPIS